MLPCDHDGLSRDGPLNPSWGRVKHAYLQMNASGILERLSAVHDKIVELRALLKGSDVVHTWTCPTDIPQDTGGNTDDPNRICHPQVFDFDVE